MSYHSAQDPEENLPDWLKALRKRQHEEDPQPEQPPQEPEQSAPEESPNAAGEEPGWLQEIRKRYRPGQEPEPDVRRQSTEQPSSMELGDTQPNRPARFEPEPFSTEPEEEPEPTTSNVPAWLAEESEPAEEALAVEHPDYEAPAVRAFTTNEEPLEPAELPSWLQSIRPSNYPAEDARSGVMLPGIEETAGPLAGLSDVLPAQPGIGQIAKPPVFSNRIEVTENQGLHASAFKYLLVNEAASVEDESQRVAVPTRVLNIVMSTVLLLAILVPLLSGSQASTRPEPNYFPEAGAVFSEIDVLPEDAPVLIAFDMQPQQYGEMRAVVSTVLVHLLNRQASLTFVSTHPSGPALAERLLNDGFREVPAIATQHYTNLGYLSGGTAAIRSFVINPRQAELLAGNTGLDPWDAPALQTIDSIDDFAFVLVVSSSPEDAQAWIEQGAASLPNGLFAITSAQAAPLLRAYLQADPLTLRGMLSGLQGAALYERMRGQDGLGRAYWDSYSFGLGAVLLLILLGGLYGRLIQIRPEKTSQRAA